MRVLLGAIAIVAASCDPPPPSYPQYAYGGDPNPPPAYSTDPNAPPPGPPPGAAQPPGYTQPPPGYAQPPPGYPSTGQPPPPGYTSTAQPPGPPMPDGAPQPGGPPTPGAPPTPAPPPAGPPAPPPGAGQQTIDAGDYACWQIGMSGYVASNLVSIRLAADGSYQVSGRNNAGGTYRTDTVSVYLTGGPLDGWIGAIGANAKGPLVRFRPDVPSDPGRDLHQGDQLCFLHL